ncbi:4-nitrophenylphosphatase [[Candida] jaroonii]|uniref:4-nitrophenylphosphatase n=1 Tax=[Candida] jaroonii TaxID=467808 RepID=A0ACA9YG79_9ASCO|nr:4-nitrophenylphosphatase [[Candida] jaroonii]
MSTKVSTSEQVKQLLDAYDYFLFDCDGVLWLGDHILPKVAETLKSLKSHGKTVIFVTNNSTKSRKDYLKKFLKFGIEGINKTDIFGSSYATAIYINKILKLPLNEKIWILGEEGIKLELEELGYKTLGANDSKLNEDKEFNPDHEMLTELDPEVGCVVAGLCLNLNYLKLSITMQYLLTKNKSLPFIATNIDSTFPSKGKLLIGAGSIIETVSYASERKPDAICGKPNQSMMNSIKADYPELQANPKRGLMIGDRLNTDMKFGKLGGLDTLLVLTGIETEERVLSLTEEQPTYYMDKLGDIFELTRE